LLSEVTQQKELLWLYTKFNAECCSTSLAAGPRAVPEAAQHHAAPLLTATHVRGVLVKFYHVYKNWHTATQGCCLVKPDLWSK